MAIEDYIRRDRGSREILSHDANFAFCFINIYIYFFVYFILFWIGQQFGMVVVVMVVVVVVMVVAVVVVITDQWQSVVVQLTTVRCRQIS